MKNAAPLQKQTQQTAVTNADSKAVFNPLQLKTDAGIAPITIKQNPLQLLSDKSEKTFNNPLQLQLNKENKTGLPDNLKTGIENLSGFSMDDVKVHYNSEKPAALNALAYAQGTNIHIAPAQEEHLPHETWHVVQQKQGRVKATMQMKGVAINDNKGLEKEADEMGAKADNQTFSQTTSVLKNELPAFKAIQKLAAQSNSRPVSNNITPGGIAAQPLPPVQAKFKLSDKEGGILSKYLEKKDEVVEGLITALRTKRAALKQYEEKENDVDKYVDHEKLKLEIESMFDSTIDYGEVNVDSEQQLALFYFRIKRQLDPEQHKERLETAKETGKANARDFDDKRNEGSYEFLVKHSVFVWEGKEIDKVYKLAILGSGASVAYYIANNLHNIDREKTILIGTEQPWRKERGAKGVINHPLNMISPTNAKGNQLKDKEGGLAGRQDFSDEIDTIVNEIPRETGAIKSVKKQGYATKYYRIEAGDKIIYAQNVVAGLGIGKHKLPEDVEKDVTKQEAINKPENTYKENIPRVLNMDQFQQAISEGTISGSEIESMVISGPNAAIDLATTAIREKIKNVSWIVGFSGPMFLPGTDNVYAETSAKQATGNEENIKKDGEITYYKYYYSRVEVTDKGVKVFYKDRNKEIPKPIEAALLVYGLGPDTKSLKEIFTVSKQTKGKEDSIDLEAVYDINQHFNRDDSEVLEAGLYRYFSYYYRNKKKTEESQVEDKVEEAVNICKRILFELPQEPAERKEPAAFSTPVAKKLPAVLGIKAKKDDQYDESSLEFIGGAAYRLAENDKIKYAYVSQAFENLLNGDFARLTEKLQGEEYSSAHLGRLKQYLEFSKKLAHEMENNSKWEAWDKKYYEERVIACRAILADMLKDDPKFSKPNADRYKSLLRLATHYQYMMEEYHDNNKNSQSDQDASRHMLKIPKTLPQNVLLSDQLTAVRSSIEARLESIPAHIEKGVNLVTSNSTVISAYMASAFGNIPNPLADHLVNRIVFERRHLADKYGPLPEPKDKDDPESRFKIEKQNLFQEKWNKILGSVNKDCSVF